MLEEERYQQLANRLLIAERDREAISPITDEFKDITIIDAYEVQMHVVKEKLMGNNRLVGKKIGLTSLAMQNLMGIYEPDYGHLFSNMEVPNGEVIHLSELIEPMVEAEVAFLLKKDLTGPGVSVTDVLRSTEAVIPSLEIVDSRIKHWSIKTEDTIADNASSAKFVLGGRITRAEDLDLDLIGLVFKQNCEVLGTAAGAAVMGHPAVAVAWLANKMAEFDITLKAGEIVLSGALTAAVAPNTGDYFEACFDKLGTVSVRFGR